MASPNVELVRRAVEAVIRQPKPDYVTVNKLYHPDHEFISAVDALEGGKHLGGRGYRDWMLKTRDTVTWTQKLEQVREIDNERLLVITPTSILARLSGIALREQRLGWIVTVHDGKIVRTEVYSSPEEALEAVALES